MADSGHDQILDENTDLPVCDYDENPTKLYKAMEEHQWGAVARFLKTGVWPGSFLSDNLTPKEQARTWIHRYDDSTNEIHDDRFDHTDGTIAAGGYNFNTVEEKARVASVRRANKRVLRWRQLPLHAALIFMAPPLVVKQLIEIFPYALRCADDKGMLPLHLAFRQAVPDDVLTILLKLFPNGMHVRDSKGRLPVECVRMDLLSSLQQGSTPTVRGMIIQSVMQQSKDKYSQAQKETVEQFQKDIDAMKSKMQHLEIHLQDMDEREGRTRHELHTTLDQFHALRKDHRKLQELQRYSLQKVSEQEALWTEKEKNRDKRRNFSMPLPLYDHDRHHHHHLKESRDELPRRNNNNNNVHRAAAPLPPPSRTPSSPPSLPRRDDSSGRYTSSAERDYIAGALGGMSNHRERTPTQSSYYLNKYDDDHEGIIPDETEDPSVSYTTSSRYSDTPPATDGIPPAYSTAHTDAYTAKSSVAPSIFKQATRDTMYTRDTGYTASYYGNNNDSNHHRHGKTPRSRGDELDEIDASAGTSLRALHGHSTGNTGLSRRPKAKAVYPITTVTDAANGGNQTTGGTTRPWSPLNLNWDFSGFLKPLISK